MLGEVLENSVEIARYLGRADSYRGPGKACDP